MVETRPHTLLDHPAYSRHLPPRRPDLGCSVDRFSVPSLLPSSLCSHQPRPETQPTNVFPPQNRLGILTMLICFTCIFLDKAEIILFARGTLKPLLYLVFQCVKAALWFIIFMLTVLGAALWQGENIGSDSLIMWSVLVEAVVLL